MLPSPGERGAGGEGGSRPCGTAAPGPDPHSPRPLLLLQRAGAVLPGGDPQRLCYNKASNSQFAIHNPHSQEVPMTPTGQTPGAQAPRARRADAQQARFDV
jgi:hypothetical protein